MGSPKDIVLISPEEKISQAPARLSDIILKIISHASVDVFPTTDLIEGRIAHISETSPDLPDYRGWLCAYRPSSTATIKWEKLLRVTDRPATMSELAAAISLMQPKVTGAASTALAGNFTPGTMVAVGDDGKLYTIEVPPAGLTAAMQGYDQTKGSLQAQLAAKQPNIVVSTARPTNASTQPDGSPYPDNTLWIVI